MGVRSLHELKCPAILINSGSDHVHILFDLARTCAMSDVVEKLKTASSKWMKRQGVAYQTFSWQGGYGAFAVSESMIETVRGYIARQAEHHRTVTFQEEYRAFLERHRIEYDERYVWD
jgi:REP element-mobilizing transposase RayT